MYTFHLLFQYSKICCTNLPWLIDLALRKHVSEYLHQSTLKNVFKIVNTSEVIVCASLHVHSIVRPPVFIPSVLQ